MPHSLLVVESTTRVDISNENGRGPPGRDKRHIKTLPRLMQSTADAHGAIAVWYSIYIYIELYSV